MRIRPYIESKDYKYLEKWIDSERIHALWCANQIPYPVSKEGFHGKECGGIRRQRFCGDVRQRRGSGILLLFGQCRR